MAKYLLYEEASEEVVIAGILHDTLEDSKTKKQDLIQFGNEVVELVDFCSEPENTIDAENQKVTWKERKLHSINIIRESNKKSGFGIFSR